MFLTTLVVEYSIETSVSTIWIINFSLGVNNDFVILFLIKILNNVT